MKVIECCQYAPKSSIKAGDAVSYGEYMFFTSSSDESKRFSDYLFDGEGIIMGTGGNATLHYYDGRYAVSTDCLVLVPDESVKCKYLYYFFKANMDVLERGFKGAGLRHTNKQYIGNIELGEIPSLDYQIEVIEILDKIEKIIAMEKKQLMELDYFIQSRFVEMFGNIIQNDKQWSVLRFSDITSSRLGKMLDTKQQTGQRSFPYLANFNVQWFRFELDNLNQMDFSEADQEEFKLEEGDLLVCEGGEIGRCAIWHNEIQPCYFQKALHRVRCNQQIILPDYLAWWFQYNCEHKGFSAIEGAKATIAHLPGAKLKVLPVVTPPLELQSQFAVFVRQVDKLKAMEQKSLEKLQLLFDSLMQKYFG